MNSAPPITAESSSGFSSFRALPYWYIACRSRDLGLTPIQAQLWDTPIVLFRDGEGKANALVDRCPHRNVPLSEGRCVDGALQCAYHGWQFEGDGRCRSIPALCAPIDGNAKRATPFPVREQQGYIWVFTDPEAVPDVEPFAFPHVDHSDYLRVTYETSFNATLHATAENILDVPHTGFLHAGLFRGRDTNLVKTVVRRWADRVECQFVGEPRPSGLMGWILAPGGGEVEHYDRFLLPSVAFVEYRLRDLHLTAVSVLAPISTFETKMYAAVTISRRWWTPLVRPFVTPVAQRVVAQDAVMLERQTSSIQAFGGERYAFSDADVLGPGITRLLKRASRDRVPITIGAPEGQPEAVTEGELLA